MLLLLLRLLLLLLLLRRCRAGLSYGSCSNKSIAVSETPSTGRLWGGNVETLVKELWCFAGAGAKSCADKKNAILGPKPFMLIALLIKRLVLLIERLLCDV